MPHPNCNNHLHKQMSRRQLNIQNIEPFHSSKAEKLFNNISKIRPSKCVSFHLAGSNIYRTVPCDRPGKLDKVVEKLCLPDWRERAGESRLPHAAPAPSSNASSAAFSSHSPVQHSARLHKIYSSTDQALALLSPCHPNLLAKFSHELLKVKPPNTPDLPLAFCFS